MRRDVKGKWPLTQHASCTASSGKGFSRADLCGGNLMAACIQLAYLIEISERSGRLRMLPYMLFHPDHMIPAVKFIAACMEFADGRKTGPLVE